MADFLPPGAMIFWIVAFPVIGFALLCLFGRTPLMQHWGDKIATSFMGLSMVLAAFVAFDHISAADPHHVFYSSVYTGWVSTADTLPGTASNPIAGGDSRLVLALGVNIDNFGALMLCMVTMVSFLVHLFSTAYMHGEIRYLRFFCILQLFTAAMLGLLVSDNLVTLYVCWELMGFASYSLIGHYYEKHSARMAAIKAFMTTRLGDVLMFIGMMILWANIGSLRYEDIYAGVAQGMLSYHEQMWAGILIFMGAVGKSAQFPLHVWLPDAMEGPTPVSALIHAATMVAAGVYLTARMVPMMTSETLLIVAYIGGFTALFAATIGVAQDDIKKVLAYSTISQLGYMILGLGLAGVTLHGYEYGVYHLTTHAFFKACLFLGSGSVIHAMHHEQRMSKYGGLWHKLPITFATFLIATLCLTGAYQTSGFFSKDGIIASAIEFGFLTDPAHMLLPIFAIFGAGFTAFYMFRLIFLTFFGHARDHHAYDHAHESGWQMATPLVVLATVSLLVGIGGGAWFKHLNPQPRASEFANENVLLIGSYREARRGEMKSKSATPAQGHAHAPTAAPAATPAPHASLVSGTEIVGKGDGTTNAIGVLAQSSHDAAAAHSTAHHEHMEHVAHQAHVTATLLSFVLFFGGVILAALFYLEGVRIMDPATIANGPAKPIYNLLLNKYYIDEIYGRYVVKPTLQVCEAMFKMDAEIVDGAVNAVGRAGVKASYAAGAVDVHIVDGAVNRLAGSVSAWGTLIAKMQSGNLRTYLFSLIASVLTICIVFLVFPGEFASLLEAFGKVTITIVGWFQAILTWFAYILGTVFQALFGTNLGMPTA